MIKRDYYNGVNIKVGVHRVLLDKYKYKNELNKIMIATDNYNNYRIIKVSPGIVDSKVYVTYEIYKK